MHPHDTRSVSRLCASIDAGARPAFLPFWGHRPANDGSVGKSCFSQWYEAPFSAGDVAYATAEHYMMAEKARLFADAHAVQRILAARSPAAAKAIGREIRGFDEDRWRAHRWSVVVAANMGKFSQNAALKTFLLNTGERILVEASPVDAIWGIGLAADDPRAGLPYAWQGMNLLGFALMEVRERLRAKA